MTPNPKNIGAAPEGFSLEVGKTYITRDRQQLFTVVKIEGPDYPDGSRIKALRHNGGTCWFSRDGLFNAGDDTWDLVANAPSPDAVGVPEPSPAKGPSEVTQPGEGVDLEAAGTWFSTMQPNATSREFGLGLIAEVRSLRSALEGLYDKGWTKEAIEAARVALRRESK